MMGGRMPENKKKEQDLLEEIDNFMSSKL